MAMKCGCDPDARVYCKKAQSLWDSVKTTQRAAVGESGNGPNTDAHNAAYESFNRHFHPDAEPAQAQTPRGYMHKGKPSESPWDQSIDPERVKALKAQAKEAERAER